MKKVCICLAAMAFTVGLTGCGQKIPDDIIQPEVMEALLYDYHLATTLTTDLSYQENYKKDAYMAYVFQKHHVTREEFDSSMVWYTRNTKQLADLYEKVQKRFEADENHLKQQLAKGNNQIAVSLSGDTADVWQDRRLYWLSASRLTNKLVFDLKADTTFHPYDAMELKADVRFLSAKPSAARLVMGLRFHFDNDSIQGITKVVSASGPQTLALKADSAFKFKSVSGFMYYTDSTYTSGSVLLHNISLKRYHQPKP